MTSAGSSVMGLSPPGTPYNNISYNYDDDNDDQYYDSNFDRVDRNGRAVTPGMGYRILPDGPLPGTPLYYSPVRDQNGRAVSPVHPSRRTPGDLLTRSRSYGRSYQNYANTRSQRAKSPTATAKYTSDTVLDAEWNGWPEQKRKNGSKGGKMKRNGSRGRNAIKVFE